jgi:hypothetical protein
MAKTDERRLDRVEGSLTPREAFLLWMGEAHQHESWQAYVLSLKDQPIEQHPYRVLPQQVEEAVRAEHRGQQPWEVEQRVVRAVREVSFYLELHEAVTGRFALEWRALALQVLVALDHVKRVVEASEPTPQDINRARQWAVDALGELLMWQTAARRIGDQYLGGTCPLFPDQVQRLAASIEHAESVLALLNDHLDWLQYLRERGGKQAPPAGLALDLVGRNDLDVAVEREAAKVAQQIVAMAKAEAAMYVHEPKLAVELLGQVWIGLAP